MDFKGSRISSLIGPISIKNQKSKGEGVLGKAIKGMDIVSHLAAAKSEMLPYEILYEVNVGGTRNVLEINQ